MKKRSLTLMSLLFLFPLAAEEGSLNFQRTDEKVFVKPYVAKLAEQVASQAGKAAKNSAVASKKEAKSLPALVSINVGCNVPATGHILSQEGCKVVGLSAYIAEMAKTIDANGNAVITAPASYDVVFTDGSQSDEKVYAHIDQVLSKVGSSFDPEVIAKGISELKEVNRATFVRREDKLVLVISQKALNPGEAIWRKTPDGAVQDIYHSEEEFLVAFRNAGLHCEEIVRPSFFGLHKWQNYNNALQDKTETLGAAYMENNPFTIYHIVKKAKA